MFIFIFESEFDVLRERVYLFREILKSLFNNDKYVIYISEPHEWSDDAGKNKRLNVGHK